MRIFIDIGHPGDGHYFKHFIRIVESKGATVFVTARDKDMTHQLLKEEGIGFYDRGKGGHSIVSKGLYFVEADKLLYKLARNFNADFHLSFASPYLAHVSKLLGKPHIAFSDTEHNKIGHLSYRPFTDVILTPDAYRGNDFNKQIRFKGYMESCYLHPNHFQPDRKILEQMGVGSNETYSVLRFVTWDAIHDVGHEGLSTSRKINVVKNKMSMGGCLLRQREFCLLKLKNSE